MYFKNHQMHFSTKKKTNENRLPSINFTECIRNRINEIFVRNTDTHNSNAL